MPTFTITTIEPFTLEALQDALVQAILYAVPSAVEGKVMTIGPPPYRRIDCDGRALAYLRPRSRKHCVRIDVSGLWRVQSIAHPLAVPTSNGLISLTVRSLADVKSVAAYLQGIVDSTRDLQKAHDRSGLGNFVLR